MAYEAVSNVTRSLDDPKKYFSNALYKEIRSLFFENGCFAKSKIILNFTTGEEMDCEKTEIMRGGLQ